MGPFTGAEKRENGVVEPFSLGCEKKIRPKGAGETLLRQYTWVLSVGGVQVCVCTVEKR